MTEVENLRKSLPNAEPLEEKKKLMDSLNKEKNLVKVNMNKKYAIMKELDDEIKEL